MIFVFLTPSLSHGFIEYINSNFQKKKKKRKGQFRTPVEKVSLRPADLPFPDKLPEKYPLIEVLANLWGTKFRFVYMNTAQEC